MSKYIKTLRNIGVALIFLLVLLLLLGTLPLFLLWLGKLHPGLPAVFVSISDELLNIFAWVIPVIFFLFFSPAILDYARKPDIDFIFRDRGDRNLLITIVNKGDTAFSFNRVQFYVRKPRIAKPEDGRITDLWFRKAGETLDYEMREDAGCTAERGIPLTFWTHKKDIHEWLSHIREKAPNKPIHCRIYFE